MKRTLLIDGDIVAYQQAAKAEVPIHWGDDFWTLHADAKEAKVRIDEWIAGCKNQLEAQEVLVVMSDGSNFRKGLLPSYKENRKNARKPIILGELREYLFYTHDARSEPYLEADDVISLLASCCPRNEERIMVSIDKDFNTIAGLHFNWDKPELGVYEVLPHEADWFFMRQTLTGDRTDGYSGCPNIGPVKAETILGPVTVGTTVDTLWPKVVAAYHKADLPESEALLQARMARLLRKGEFNTKSKRITLWNPHLSSSDVSSPVQGSAQS